MCMAMTTPGLTVGGVPELVAPSRGFVCFCLASGSVRLRLNACIAMKNVAFVINSVSVDYGIFVPLNSIGETG